MDEIDITTDRMAIDLENRITAARNNVPHTDGPPQCEACQEDIPHVRRRLGYSLCVPCASEAERRRAMYRNA